jgi:hypothetical protein
LSTGLATASPAALPLARADEPTRGWVLSNIVLMQAGWFACVLGAAHGWPWFGTAVAAAVIGWHLWRAPRPADEARLVLAVMALGAVFDTAMLASGTLSFVNGQWWPWFTTHWMLALWALFAASLNVSLRWLKGRWWLAAALGAVAGPISFAGGSRMGAATLHHPTLALSLLSVGWAIAMPAMIALADRFDGVGAPTRRPGADA